MSVNDDWACDAYGAEGGEVGAMCFGSPTTGERVCESLAECMAFMATERQRVFRRVSERAAAGDPVAEMLEAEFAGPDEILGRDGFDRDDS